MSIDPTLELHFNDLFNGDNHCHHDEISDEEQYLDFGDDHIENSSLRSSINVPVLRKKGFDDFENLVCIGEGGYGKVYQVREITTGKIFAMKVLKKGHLCKTKSIQNTIVERDIMLKIRHPFIIDLYYAFQSQERVAFIMNYINGGQLFFHLRKEAMLTQETARFYIAELILALEHLHQQGIMHRDLKPENVLIDHAGHLVLTDFGLAKSDMYDDEGRTRTFCGTLEYMPPEMIKNDPYGKAADFWSVGILLYEMVTGDLPFTSRNRKKLSQQIISKKISLPSYLTFDTHSIIKGLTHKNPNIRLKVDQIKAHAFFNGINWEQLEAKEMLPPFVPNTHNGKLDVSNFDEEYTNQPIAFSPCDPFSASQEDLFKNFSFCASYSPIGLY
eukprot:TRINITY_DN8344_c0_g1_i1.p1 TRINITY_DN8344_c0_g1~~TRINITY_DN8344_c0_g1_i1.p1  ORF type:complete len:387 (-),score=67.43 TRINITY_DN8344_c0_g1_i1:36-1196(-)